MSRNPPGSNVHSLDPKKAGERNNQLFKQLLQQAPSCDTIEDLHDIAHTLNGYEFDDPLPGQEVDKTVRSAWKYQVEDKNWVGRKPRIILTEKEWGQFAAHKKGGDALILYCKLKSSHAVRGQPFAISTTAMARDDVLPSWSEWRYRRARDLLVSMGWLVEIRTKQRDSEGRQTANIYSFSDTVVRTHNNITKTPPSPVYSNSDISNSKKLKRRA